jgi:AsmA protein
MSKVLKVGGIALGLVVALVIGAVVLVPMFVDVQRYKPQIEALVTEQTGRKFSMGDDIKLSVFPWVGVSLSDLALGNAKGFGSDEMISVKRFEVRLKVMPLLSKKIEVDTFLMDSPQIRLVKNKAGKGNWENLGPEKAAKEQPKAKTEPGKTAEGGLPIASFMVGKFSIINGLLSYVDQAAGMSKEISDLNLDLTDITLDNPITVNFSAKVDGHPLSLSGKAGPIGQEPGKSDIGLDLVVKALDTLELTLKGQVIQPMTAQKLDMEINLAPFSPRKLFDRLGQPFPVKTSDPKVLDKVSLKAKIKGSAKAIALSDGTMVLDDSTLTFSAQAKAFDKPDLRFDLNLDAIDVDRYLPPAEEGKTAPPKSDKTAKSASGKKGKTDYAPLRKMVLDGKAMIGKLKAANLKMENMIVHVTGKNGVFNLNPFSVDLYQGKAGVKAQLDVRKNTPATNVTIKAQGIQAGPMIKDAAQKEVIEGTLASDITLAMVGDTPDQIKKSLGGKGNLTFLDGAIVGIDIAGTIRNAASGLGLGEKPAKKPRTDFAELKIPFTANKGIVTVPGASLVSPLLRLSTQGKTNLVKEDLDFRVDPKLVATLKGQGDTKDRSGVLVPLLITGTYAAPKIRPDLKAMIGGQLPDEEGIKKLIKGDDSGKSTEDKAKGLIKGLFN